MTGRLPSVPGVQTLSVRQSSPWAPVISPVSVVSGSFCGDHEPNSAVDRTCDHGSTGRGARSRCSPTGGAAYGTPRNTRRLPSIVPSTLPDVVSTTVIPQPLSSARDYRRTVARHHDDASANRGLHNGGRGEDGPR